MLTHGPIYPLAQQTCLGSEAFQPFMPISNLIRTRRHSERPETL